jgi:hypothetical protein
MYKQSLSPYTIATEDEKNINGIIEECAIF